MKAKKIIIQLKIINIILNFTTPMFILEYFKDLVTLYFKI